MRVSAWLVALSLALCSATAGAAPVRVVSLNLCTDELLMLLAEARQIASVTHLSQMPEETSLWRQARRYPANDGSLARVIPIKPDLILTMGGGARDRNVIAHRLRVPLLDLPYPQNLTDIRRSIVTIAGAIGRPTAGQAMIARIDALQRSRPRLGTDAIWLGGGGRTVAATSLAADWMRLAGLKQRSVTGDRISLEQLLVRPPQILLRSDYRSGQYSGEQRWLSHPLARKLRAGREAQTDGRPWTCLGPLMIGEIERLKRVLGR